jgi:type II secretory pathway pseudopilin PulG
LTLIRDVAAFQQQRTEEETGDRTMTKCRERRVAALCEDAGFSLLELLVASLVSLFVVGGVMSMLVSIQDTHRDQQQLIDIQQGARIAMSQLQRDIQIAGVGLTWLLPPTPVIIPRPDGGIDIRQNQGGLMSGFAADMTGNNDPISVLDVTGFQVGMEIAVYDGGGAIDFTTITAIDAATDRISHTGVSKAFTLADGSAVARVLTVSYFLQNSAGTMTLVREQDGALTAPLATNIVAAGTSITYWDDSNPSVVFNPASNADQLRITMVEITLELQTEDPRLNTNIRPTTTLTFRVTPRAVVLS